MKLSVVHSNVSYAIAADVVSVVVIIVPWRLIDVVVVDSAMTFVVAVAAAVAAVVAAAEEDVAMTMTMVRIAALLDDAYN